MSSKFERAEKLFQEILTDKNNLASDGVVLNDMLDEFVRGYPSKRILHLLNSEYLPTVQAGAWLLSELGSSVCGFFGKFKHLIDSSDVNIQFDIMSSILLCAGTEKDADAIYKLSCCLDSDEKPVCWKAIDTLIRLEKRQVLLCLDWLNQSHINDSFAQGFALIAEADKQTEMSLQDKLKSDDSIIKKFAFISAVRMELSRDELEKIANLSQDADIMNYIETYDP